MVPVLTMEAQVWVTTMALEFATLGARLLMRIGSASDAKFIAGKAIEAVDFLLRAKYRTEVVILDPPRTGAIELMEPLIKMRPRSIIYVSCDVSTLARDLRVLTDAGYLAHRIRGIRFLSEYASCGDRSTPPIDLVIGRS